MGSPIDREGFFQAEIVDYGMCQASDSASQSVGITLKCRLLNMWDFDQEAWVEWSVYDQEADGVQWVIKKDGSLNDLACRSLVQNAGWDGDLDSIADKTWQPTQCQVQVKREEYKGNARFRVAFINPLDKVPGVLGSLDSDSVRALKNQHGSALRALVGTVKANSAPAPKGKPAAPKPPAKTPPPAGSSKGIPAGGVPEDNVDPVTGQEIPF